MRPIVLAVAAAAWALPAAAQDTAFRSPSGNIACMMWSGQGYNAARCDIFEIAVQSFPQPADCDLDWGHAFEVEATGGGYPLCHGDTVAVPGAPVLQYGSAISLGGITCVSARSGMTCTNRQGHGFSVARAAQRVF